VALQSRQGCLSLFAARAFCFSICELQLQQYRKRARLFRQSTTTQQLHPVIILRIRAAQPAASPRSYTMSLSSYVNSKIPIPTFPLLQVVLAKLTTHSDSWVEKVLVLTSDSRTLVGTLLSCDQMTNLVSPLLVAFTFDWIVF
jgi:hypothetical protein